MGQFYQEIVFLFALLTSVKYGGGGGGSGVLTEPRPGCAVLRVAVLCCWVRVAVLCCRGTVFFS